MSGFSPVFSFFLHCCLCIWIFFKLEASEWAGDQDQNSSQFSEVILMRFVSNSFWPWSRAFVGINNPSVLCLAFPNIAVGLSTALHRCFLQGIAAGIGTFNFLRAAFFVSLSSSSFGSIKNIPFSCLALSSFGFSINHLYFAFFFATSDINFSVSGHTLSHNSFFFVHVPVIFNLFSQQYIKRCICCSGNVDALQRIRMILLSARTVWLGVQRDGDKWRSLWPSRSHF